MQTSDCMPASSGQIIEILHEVAKQLLPLNDEQEVYNIVGRAVSKIIPGVYFAITKLQPDDMNFRLAASFGFDNYLKAIKAIVGRDPFTMDFPFYELPAEQIRSFENREMIHFPGGISELTHGRISKTIGRSLERFLSIADICAFSFCIENKYLGSLTLFIPKTLHDAGILNPETVSAIETIANQASFAIKKLRDQLTILREAELLHLANLQIHTLLENSNTAFLFEDASRNILKVNQAFCKMFGIPNPKALIGLNCRIAGQRSAGLFTDPDNFLNVIESLIQEEKPCLCQELVLCDGRILERDFLPVRNDSLIGFLWQYRDITDRKRAELDLLASQAQFKSLVNHLNDIIWKSNADGSALVDLNNSFEKYYGLPVSAFNAKPTLWFDFVHPEDRALVEKSTIELFANGNTRVEYRIIRPDGRITWLDDRKSIIYDDKGIAIQMGGIASDITERKLLEEKHHIQEFALEASPIAMSLADKKGFIFYANDAYVRLWGYKNKDDVIGKHISNFSTTPEQLNQVVSTIADGRAYAKEITITRLDGSKVDAIISAILVHAPGGKPLCQMALFNDITQIKQLQRELQDKSDNLQELMTIKDKFFSIVAHDLKGPFNAILGFTDHLSSDYHDLTDDQRIGYIDVLKETSTTFYNHLEDLLEWARIQRGQYQIQIKSFELWDLIIKSLAPYLANALAKELQVINRVPKDVFIKGDFQSLRTLFGNLISNAIKFTPNNGIIELECMVGNNFTEVIIRDNGIGMSEEKINSLFSLDESQSTRGTNNEKGTGMGLFLCKELIEKNAGKLRVESQPGKGSSFIVSLPCT